MKLRKIIDNAILSGQSNIFTGAYYDLRAGKNITGNTNIMRLDNLGIRETEGNKELVKIIDNFEELLYKRGQRTGNADVSITDEDRQAQIEFGKYKFEFNPITSRYFNSFIDLGRLYEVGGFYESIGNDITEIENEIDEIEDYIKKTKEKAYNIIREFNDIKIEL